jgi:CheY-like chemotaxis protein
MASEFILNVDDHAPTRFVRTRILERAGYGVREADSAADALEGAPGASLVLLDVRLPDGDGFTVCEQVKQRQPALPVVMITSVYRTSQARRDAFTAGADAFLLEPVDADQLVRTVQGLTGPSRAAFRDGAAAWIVTDAAGHILDISAEGARLLNLSARGARGRSLPAFFTQNRPRLLDDLLRAAEGTLIERSVTLQPRDRKARPVHLALLLVPTAPGERVQIRWELVEPGSPAEQLAV